jgi:hypothetical protein
MKLAVFQCPFCGAKVKALPSSTVEHRCPERRSLVTKWAKVEENVDNGGMTVPHE